eukprot:9307859-Pyramimonas_sp.AAC.2
MEYTAEVPGSFPADLRDEDDTLKTYLQSIPPPPTSYEAIVFANEERGYLAIIARVTYRSTPIGVNRAMADASRGRRYSYNCCTIRQ